jgi:hypothetical protein
MSIVICRRLEFTWRGVHKSRYKYITCSIVSITLLVTAVRCSPIFNLYRQVQHNTVFQFLLQHVSDMQSVSSSGKFKSVKEKC